VAQSAGGVEVTGSKFGRFDTLRYSATGPRSLSSTESAYRNERSLSQPKRAGG